MSAAIRQSIEYVERLKQQGASAEAIGLAERALALLDAEQERPPEE